MGNVLETPLFKARIAEWEAAAAAEQQRLESLRSSAAARRDQAAILALQRMYAAARPSRLRADFNPTDTSADAELVGSLTKMRARSRELIRDSSLASRAQKLVWLNVIGNGIGMQAAVKNSRGGRHTSINGAIEEAWAEWSLARFCHKGKRLGFAAIERFCMAQVFAAGEVFIRLHMDNQGSGIPLALEVIEAERIADEFTSPQVSSVTGNEVRMGVEVDEYFAPVAYYVRDRHPNEVRFRQGGNTLRRIPADQIIHLALVDRWPQTRGEPWLHSSINRFSDSDGYVESELYRARTQAATPGAIETPEDVSSFGESNGDGSVTMELEPGVLKRLNPGEKLHMASPNSPNPQLDPFMRFLIREMAAGANVSYESLSRDYSQSNYSSSRLALLDDRDLWRFFQSWFITDFRQEVHRRWMEAAVLASAIPGISMASYAANPRQFLQVRYKPRGWTWVDPTKEVAAYKEAVKAGFTTVTDVIAATGGGQDIEDVVETRAQELELMREHDLVFETSPEFYDKEEEPAAPGGAPRPNPEGDETDEDAEGEKKPARVLSIAR